ncbi:MAG TPA: tetratricopeptide repeat protein, partial [Thermomicrobiales bacterium]|nr:tetratricopeptide repeat protein [Thermomicrobiales bacterium]
ALAANPSVRLFVDRAGFARPDSALTPANAAAVAAVCARLDGLPLALELAAAWVAHLPVGELAARLDDAPRLLAGAGRVAPDRQRTLRATLDWSVALLTPAERALLARLAVFAGGWTLAAAEAVCPDDALPAGEILPLLAALVDQSLVQVEAGAGDEVRYRLLEPVRQYAAERLAREPAGPGLEAALRVRHAAYFLALAEAAGPELFGPAQPVWLARLEAEHDNLRAALRRALARGEATVALRLASALGEFWTTREHGREGRRWLEAALAAGGGAAPAWRAPALAGQGYLAWKMGDYPAARAAAEEALALAGEARDPAAGAAAERVLGLVAANRGDVVAAVAHYDAALALLGPNPAPPRAVELLNDLALSARERGDAARAVAYLEEALRLLRPAGSPAQTARTLINLAFLAFAAREYPRAGALLREALPLCRRAGAWRMAGQCLLNIGWIAYRSGEYAEAAAAYADGLRLVRHSGSPRDVVAAVYGLALVAWGQGTLQRAALLHGAVAAQREAFDCPLTDADRALLADRLDLTPLRAGLGEDAFAAAWAAGYALSLEGTIAAALADAPASRNRER